MAVPLTGRISPNRFSQPKKNQRATHPPATPACSPSLQSKPLGQDQQSVPHQVVQSTARPAAARLSRPKTDDKMTTVGITSKASGMLKTSKPSSSPSHKVRASGHSPHRVGGKDLVKVKATDTSTQRADLAKKKTTSTDPIGIQLQIKSLEADRRRALNAIEVLKKPLSGLKERSQEYKTVLAKIRPQLNPLNSQLRDIDSSLKTLRKT